MDLSQNKALSNWQAQNSVVIWICSNLLIGKLWCIFIHQVTEHIFPEKIFKKIHFSPLFFSLLKMIPNILNLQHFPEKCSQEPRRKIKIQVQFKTENLEKVSLADKGRERKENWGGGGEYSSYVDRYNSQLVDYPEKAIARLFSPVSAFSLC